MDRASTPLSLLWSRRPSTQAKRRERHETSPSFPETKVALKGRKGPESSAIANDQSIAWGCAKAFSRALAQSLRFTYLNERAKKEKHVEPLAKGPGSSNLLAALT